MSVVFLPWPSHSLHPNARVHFMQKAKSTKKARSDAIILAKQAGFERMGSSALSVTAVFYPPDDRRRDQDGMLSSIKPYLDGISDVVGIDDSRWTITIRREPKTPNGMVAIEIEANDEAWEQVGKPAARVLANVQKPERGAA